MYSVLNKLGITISTCSEDLDSEKQINCYNFIEFLRLCEVLALHKLNFAKVEKPQMEISSETFTKNVLAKDLPHEERLSASLKREINSIHADEIR